MAHNYGKTFIQLMTKLRKNFPLKRPLRIVCKCLKQQDMCGQCVLYFNTDGTIRQFVIEIDSSLNRLTAIDTLLHEYAHAMDQDQNGPFKEPHRKSWGVCYARVWRFYDTHS